MSSKPRGGSPVIRLVAALPVAIALLALVPARAEDPAAQRTFDTPQAAVEAVIAAAQANDDAALLAIFGPEAQDLMQDGNDPSVRRERAGFVEAAKAKVVFEGEGDVLEVVVGPEAWPFPIPLVKADGAWRFDTPAGREEILARRIGRNELEAIEVCETYADAQVTYAMEDRDGDEVREYAQRLVSTEGQQDGLYWEAEEGSDEEESPLGPLVASMQEYLGGMTKGTPFYGYYWKILKAQGPNAPGGAHSYVINGNMIAGFALVGVPARYRQTGVMTFLVSHHGRIFEKDLGENSVELAKAMEAFDPDDTWSEVDLDEVEAE